MAGTFTEKEIEFLAEDELISIVPNFRGETFHMISGEFGPFRPQIALEVPLWLALALKSRGKCTIQPPEWMSVEKLTATLQSERVSSREFQPLPFHYLEIANLLIDAERRGEDIPDKYHVKSLLKDIQDVRLLKIQEGLSGLTGRQRVVKVANLSALEVNMIRPFFSKALATFFELGTD
eukprot:TRINITY_DN9782_c0_g1_i1.p1 TRINITY_DN9782_c0_g1~~TRINITY_DN9782_c0_g1_i1.p1  ORF type:complete len:179 (-),score=36.12 TRINITY_DN9782_c0_g1_i1:439-975(-)